MRDDAIGGGRPHFLRAPEDEIAGSKPGAVVPYSPPVGVHIANALFTMLMLTWCANKSNTFIPSTAPGTGTPV
jgi:hypothetical protein